MAVSSAQACEWVGYINEDFAFDDFPPQARVLDVGFGIALRVQAQHADRGVRLVERADGGDARRWRSPAARSCRWNSA